MFVSRVIRHVQERLSLGATVCLRPICIRPVVQSRISGWQHGRKVLAWDVSRFSSSLNCVKSLVSHTTSSRLHISALAILHSSWSNQNWKELAGDHANRLVKSFTMKP